MYGVVSCVHQKEREKEREREKPRGDAMLHYFFFCKHLQLFAGDARTQEAVVSNFWNTHWLQMNETVVRFDLVNT